MLHARVCACARAYTNVSSWPRFMEGGGWALLNLWLAEAKKVQNFPLVVEILQVAMTVVYIYTSL